MALFSAIQERCLPGQTLLDLGCGPRDQHVPAEHLGLRYLGVDIESPAADILADAHALAFGHASFDFVLSYAVLEHLYNPFLALREVRRVLKPEGIFFGTVSQGEPFHGSYFHHTSWGLAHVLASSGFLLERLWPSYDTLRSLGQIGRYPVLWRIALRGLSRVVDATPFLSPRAYFRGSREAKQLDRLHRAASLCFVARRLADSEAAR